MTAQLSRKRLEEKLLEHIKHGGDSEEETMIRMLLAGMDAKSRKLFTCTGCGAEGLDEPLESKCHCNEDGAHWVETVVFAAPPAPVAVPDDYKVDEIRVGRLPTMNQDEYPGLGDWWVQLRIGEDFEEVLARVYGSTPQEANNRAEALACRAATLKAGPVTAAAWIDEAKKLAEMHGTSFVVFRNGEEPQCADPSKVVISFTDKGLGYPAAPEQQNAQKNIPEIIPGGLVEAVNNLLNNDGSRGCYSAIGCGEAREKIELWLAQRQKWESQRSENLCAVNSPVIPDGWIPCSDRMPEKGGLYLCYVQDDYEFDISHFCFEYLAAHKKFDSAGIKITHWMPLPAAPEQEV